MEHARLSILFKKHIKENLLTDEAEEMREYIANPSYASALKSLITEELSNPESTAHHTSAEVNTIVEGIEFKVLACINRGKRFKIIPLNTYGQYAAMVAAVLLVLFSVLLYRSGNTPGNDPKQHSVASDDEILPGTNRASLLLGNGKVISLSAKVEGIVTDGQQLRYENGKVLIDHIAGKTFTLSVPRAGKYKLRLSDGTQVWLNAASSITYPAKFAGAARRVKIKGESYFKVAHDQQHPFIVESELQSIKVLGTEFNVNTYNTNKSVTTLIDGSIALRTAQNDFKTLIPGDQAVLREGSIQVRKVYTPDYIAWKDNLIIMDDQDVNEVLRQLERWYDVAFINPEELPAGKRLSGEIPRDTAISTILRALEIQLHIKFEIKGRNIIIKR